MKEFENKFEVIETVDDVTYWLDRKNLSKALESFTEDAHLTVAENGKNIAVLEGKEAIREHLTSRMEKLDLLFHNNGTRKIQILSIDEKAVSCTSSIVKMTTGDPAVTTDEDLYYEDKLIKVNGFWYIVDRTIQIVSKSIH